MAYSIPQNIFQLIKFYNVYLQNVLIFKHKWWSILLFNLVLITGIMY